MLANAKLEKEQKAQVYTHTFVEDIPGGKRMMLRKFKDLTEKAYSKEMEYVKCYGPLEVMDSESLSKFEWINNPWPWENTGGTKYV